MFNETNTLTAEEPERDETINGLTIDKTRRARCRSGKRNAATTGEREREKKKESSARTRLQLPPFFDVIWPFNWQDDCVFFVQILCSFCSFFVVFSRSLSACWRHLKISNNDERNWVRLILNLMCVLLCTRERERERESPIKSSK